jgi:single-stranded-DNA-specific exonuclease
MRGSTKWEVVEPQSQASQSLATALKVSPILAQLLWNRGFKDEVSAKVFLNCQLRDLADPFLLPDMDRAVERVLKAIEQDEEIVLYGDYDVDGVTSVAMLERMLLEFGASKVRSFLPDRFDEGYGLTLSGLERCLSKSKPGLMIVLDCGTNSKTEVAKLLEMKVDLIILDHHEPASPATPLALVNYKLKKDARTSDEYCTAGLVFKFCHAMLKIARQRKMPKAEKIDLKNFLDLVALATVADIAPLKGENRIFAKHGLRQMAKTQSMGLRALMQISGITSEPTGYDCGFRLGPRLNAAGRLESAMASLQLLLSNDEEESHTIAQQLDSTNRDRQAEDARVFVEARAQAEAQAKNPETRVLVVSRPGWHEGVVGIVASRIVREFHLPTFVIALNDEGTGKGSGRSIEGFDLAQALESTRSFLLRGGGHAMAAGVSLEVGKIDAWREALQIHAKSEQGLDGEKLKRVIRADVEVSFSDLSMSLVDELQLLEPCGMGNPRPILLSRKVDVAVEPKTVGSEGKHLKLWLRQNNIAIDAIAFGRGSEAAGIHKGDQLDVIFELERNEYQGVKKLQLNIRELAKVVR